MELLNPARGEQILDLGCGTGHLSAEIARAGAEVVGVDRSPAMIEEARRNYPELRFEAMGAEEMRFDGPFDAVFSNAVLHWIRKPEKALRAVSSVLKPGGRFVAEMGGKGNVATLVAAFYGALEAVGGKLEPDPNPWYFPGIAEYAALLENAGLEVTFAQIIDRPTPLDDGENGLRTWIQMFASSFASRAPAGKEDAFVRTVEAMLKPGLFHKGVWEIDCRRLRFMARKPAGKAAVTGEASRGLRDNSI